MTTKSKCVSHTHEWSTLYTHRTERCRRYHFDRMVTDVQPDGTHGPRHGSFEVVPDCQKCGASA